MPVKKKIYTHSSKLFYKVSWKILACVLTFAPINQAKSQLLSGPEVYKLDWNTRALATQDMDNNGAQDIIVLNNERTRIEILYQNRDDLKNQSLKQQKLWHPILEDSRFSPRNIVTGVKMNALAIADLNNDGLLDLAFTSNTFGLSLLYQKAQDQWHEAKHIDYIQPSKNSSSLRITDLDGDGHQDLVLLGEKQLLVFYQDSNNQYKIPHRYPLVDNSHFSLAISDINKDNRSDIIYLAKNSRYALRLRLQNKDGSFGPEQIFSLQTPRHKFSLFTQKTTETNLAYIENKTNQMVIGSFSLNSGHNNELSMPQVYPLPFKEIKAGNYATGDINGDQAIDIIAADFKGAQIWLYRQLESGLFSKPIAFPSFSGIQAITMADLDQDNRDELYLASKTEKLIGVSRIKNNKQLSYPKPLNIFQEYGTPISLSHVQIDSKPALVALTKQKQKRHLLISRYDPKTKALIIQQTLELKNLKIDPSGIKNVDLNQDGAEDLILFVLHKPAIVLQQINAGLFEQISSHNFRQGLLDNLKPGSLTTGDINNDQINEILVAGKGFARALQSNSEQQLEIIEQYNAVNKTAPITSILPINMDEDESKEILIYQQRSEKIDIFKKDENGVYRPYSRLPSGQIDIVDSKLLKKSQTRPERVLYLGKDRFWILPIEPQKLSFEIQSRYESNLPDISYQQLASADIDHDNITDIVALDSQSTHIIEFLKNNSTGWKSLYHFEVFDTQSMSKDSRGSSNEPREILLSDINGNGKNDLIFLVHDRILIYFSN